MAFLLMASFTFEIIDTMTANTSRNLCFWNITLSRIISGIDCCSSHHEHLLKSSLRHFKMLLHGILVCLYLSPLL